MQFGCNSDRNSTDLLSRKSEELRGSVDISTLNPALPRTQIQVLQQVMKSENEHGGNKSHKPAVGWRGIDFRYFLVQASPKGI